MGRPDQVWGELSSPLLSCDQGSRSEAELIAFARERLADYKTPETVIFRSELPKGPTGKIQRRALREEQRALAPMFLQSNRSDIFGTFSEKEKIHGNRNVPVPESKTSRHRPGSLSTMSGSPANRARHFRPSTRRQARSSRKYPKPMPRTSTRPSQRLETPLNAAHGARHPHRNADVCSIGSPTCGTECRRACPSGNSR